MINVGIVGISGYSGGEVLKLLLKHKDVRVTYVSANNTKGHVDEIWPNLAGQTNLICQTYDAKKAIEKCQCVFLAVPHTVAMATAPELIKAGLKVIDLSGDYRLQSSTSYKTWYGAEHKDKTGLKAAVYGLPELYREKIKKANLLSNPGCYPTASILGLTPLVSVYGEEITSIIIDAKSGVSGAGRKATLSLSFCEVNENFKAYKVLHHQHAPEIDLYLSKVGGKNNIQVNFVPHLLPVHRGILCTMYIQVKSKINLEKLHTVYDRFYKTEPFVRVAPLGAQVELKNVVHTNFCDIALAGRDDEKLIVVTSAIDNLVKGAAGQAVQNMNIMFGFKEEEALL